RLPVDHGVTLRGAVVDAVSAAPLAEISVATAPDLITHTDASGRFTLEGVPSQEIVALSFVDRDGGHAPEREFVRVPDGASEVDARTVRLGHDRLDQLSADGPAGFTGTNQARDGDQIVITEVRPGTPAERAGIRPGDRLLSVD